MSTSRRARVTRGSREAVRPAPSRQKTRGAVSSVAARGREKRRKVPSPLDDREASSARRAILDAAVEALEHRGESTIRISQIARKAGVAVGLIYYHFNDREGLVSAAQVERLLRAPADDVNLLEATVRLTDDPQQFVAMIARILCAGMAPERANVRLDRVSILGASKGRPAFTESIGRTLSAQADRLAAIVDEAKARGMVDPAVDARAFAVLVQAMSVGLVVADLDATPTDRRHLLDTYLRALVGFAGPAAAKVFLSGQGAERPERRRPAPRGARRPRR